MMMLALFFAYAAHGCSIECPEGKTSCWADGPFEESSCEGFLGCKEVCPVCDMSKSTVRFSVIDDNPNPCTGIPANAFLTCAEYMACHYESPEGDIDATVWKGGLDPGSLPDWMDSDPRETFTLKELCCDQKCNTRKSKIKISVPHDGENPNPCTGKDRPAFLSCQEFMECGRPGGYVGPDTIIDVYAIDGGSFPDWLDRNYDEILKKQDRDDLDSFRFKDLCCIDSKEPACGWKKGGEICLKQRCCPKDRCMWNSTKGTCKDKPIPSKVDKEPCRLCKGYYCSGEGACLKRPSRIESFPPLLECLRNPTKYTDKFSCTNDNGYWCEECDDYDKNKIEGMKCGKKLKTTGKRKKTVRANSMEKAIEKCDESDSCSAVFDPNCDGKGKYQLCDSSREFKESKSGCLYEKTASR